MMYTWNTNWVNPYESPWSIINKFMFANQIHGIDAARELTTTQLREIDNYRAKYIHTGIVSNYQFKDNTWCIGDKSIVDYGMENIKNLLKPLLSFQNRFIRSNNICSTVIKKTLNYCPECMKYGYHYIFHQFTFLDRCLVHNKKLISTCPICNEEIPYAIEFQYNIHAYQCKYCKSYLLSNDNFEILLNEWNRVVAYTNRRIPFNNSSIFPFIITNNFQQCIKDNDINNVLKSLFFNKSIKVPSKYTIKKCIHWNEINFGNVITPNLTPKKDIIEYAYVYAFQKLYRHLSKSQRLKSKLKKVENYILVCASKPLIKPEIIEKEIICFDFNAVTFYLWKRDMEYGHYLKNGYRINRSTAYSYKFNANDEIISYLDKIRMFLPEFIDEDCKFSILVHIAFILLKNKYFEWQILMKYLVENYNKYELMDKLKNITLRNFSNDYNKEFLLVIDTAKTEYKLFFDN
ncbi:hypothetical protein [Lachnoclostridium sp.]|uniref:hypothetical protein n=1 Tax=Lachnoclostridium sp. TaxID=2028282 RepID=UPI0028979143|nr:hypothetical protein [Lachnoclostridium sp.]